MIVLSYGYKLPETGDRGNIWFPALEDNITRVNGHTHNGTDSPSLTATAFSAIMQNILAASWVLVSGSTYRQLVTVPVGMTFDRSLMQFLITAGPNINQNIYPRLEKVSVNTYYVYVNDNTIALKAYYL